MVGVIVFTDGEPLSVIAEFNTDWKLFLAASRLGAVVHAALQLASLEPEGCALTGSSWAASRYVYTAGPVSSRQLSLWT